MRLRDVPNSRTLRCAPWQYRCNAAAVFVAALFVAAMFAGNGTAAGTPGQAELYTIDLVPLYGVRIGSMSDSGLMVGTYSGGGVSDVVGGLDHPWEFLCGSSGSLSGPADGINNHDTVFGCLHDEATVWFADGSGGWDVQLLGTLLGGESSRATAINNRGDIIGWSTVPRETEHVAVWFNAPEGIRNLSLLGAPAEPVALNDHGVLLSSGGDLFDIDTHEIIDLEPLPDAFSMFEGRVVNNRGDVAATVFDKVAGLWRVVRWSELEGWLQIGDGRADRSDIHVGGMNDNGALVFEAPEPMVSFDGIEVLQIAALFPPGEAGQWVLDARGEGINNVGQIAVVALNLKKGLWGAVVLTPVTEPAPGDVNADGLVNFDDLLLLLGSWGPCGGPACPGDFDANGQIDFGDLMILLANWS